MGNFADETRPLPYNNDTPLVSLPGAVEMQAFSLLAGGARCVTLLGETGIGKTALATKTCEYTAERHLFDKIYSCLSTRAATGAAMAAAAPVLGSAAMAAAPGAWAGAGTWKWGNMRARTTASGTSSMRPSSGPSGSRPRPCATAPRSSGAQGRAPAARAATAVAAASRRRDWADAVRAMDERQARAAVAVAVAVSGGSRGER